MKGWVGNEKENYSYCDGYRHGAIASSLMLLPKHRSLWSRRLCA